MFMVASVGAILLCQEYLNVHQAWGAEGGLGGEVKSEQKWSPAWPEDPYQSEGTSESQALVSCMFV